MLCITALVGGALLGIYNSMNEPVEQKTKNSYYDMLERKNDCEQSRYTAWIDGRCKSFEEMAEEEAEQRVAIQEANSRTLEAGEYVVGEDIPAGYYRVAPIGRGGNFVVFNSSGSPTVNQTLGSSSTDDDDYVYFSCTRGYKIKTQEAVKLIPIE